jgi:hypothetical protein
LQRATAESLKAAHFWLLRFLGRCAPPSIF